MTTGWAISSWAAMELDNAIANISEMNDILRKRYEILDTVIILIQMNVDYFWEAHPNI
jgi:hypothetical protein